MTDPDRLHTLIIEHLGHPEKFTWNADLRRDLGADSLDAVELAMKVEVEFGVEIPGSIADRWRTPDDLLETVRSRAAPSEYP